MEIVNYEIKRKTIIYEVLTNGDQTFTYELPKDLSSQNVRKYLKLIEQKIDHDKKIKKQNMRKNSD